MEVLEYLILVLTWSERLTIGNYLGNKKTATNHLRFIAKILRSAAIIASNWWKDVLQSL